MRHFSWEDATYMCIDSPQQGTGKTAKPNLWNHRSLFWGYTEEYGAVLAQETQGQLES